ncbi:MAG: 3-deoxy-D-manno-octulosonic acid transferase [Rhodoferax sp.]
MIRTLYGWALWLAQPLYRRKLRRRARQEPGYAHAMPERFGYYDAPWPRNGGATVWVHAVSLGETRAARVLVENLRKLWPGMRLLLTHGTATGRAEGATLLRPGDAQVWLPWDSPGAVARFLAHFRPDIGVLMETEVWPNLVHGCQRCGVPLTLANARLSEASLKRAKRLAWLARPAYRSLSAVWAQTDDDAQRLRVLGAPVRGVFGNIKFDATPDVRQLSLGHAWRKRVAKPVVMLASAREGEEASLLDCLKTFRPAAQAESTVDTPKKGVFELAQWLIVPRHPQRFDAVAALIEARGWTVLRRSQWGTQGPALQRPNERPGVPCIWLGDSLGEMATYYALSDVALLGGSFEPFGGQNLIEAAACACPVIMGPHTFNFTEAAKLAQDCGAALRVTHMTHAVRAALEWVSDDEALDNALQATQTFARMHQGAAARLAMAIQNLWRDVQDRRAGTTAAR